MDNLESKSQNRTKSENLKLENYSGKVKINQK